MGLVDVRGADRVADDFGDIEPEAEDRHARITLPAKTRKFCINSATEVKWSIDMACMTASKRTATRTK